MLEQLGALHDALAPVRAPRVHLDPRTPDEIGSGVPVLRSAALDGAVFDDAARVARQMAETLLAAGHLADQCRAAMSMDLPALARAAAAGNAPSGVATFLVWKALGRVVAADVSRWTHSHCPTCGAAPAMARLRETDNGRERLLVCGLCETRWRFARIGCPYCGNSDTSKLDVLEPEGEPYRIDVCRACNAYLKTHVAAREEPHALADWTTLHLDAACEECGLERAAPSLYSI